MIQCFEYFYAKESLAIFISNQQCNGTWGGGISLSKFDRNFSLTPQRPSSYAHIVELNCCCCCCCRSKEGLFPQSCKNSRRRVSVAPLSAGQDVA